MKPIFYCEDNRNGQVTGGIGVRRMPTHSPYFVNGSANGSRLSTRKRRRQNGTSCNNFFHPVISNKEQKEVIVMLQEEKKYLTLQDVFKMFADFLDTADDDALIDDSLIDDPEFELDVMNNWDQIASQYEKIEYKA